jgi:hypothetical protein
VLGESAYEVLEAQAVLVMPTLDGSSAPFIHDVHAWVELDPNGTPLGCHTRFLYQTEYSSYA